MVSRRAIRYGLLFSAGLWAAIAATAYLIWQVLS